MVGQHLPAQSTPPPSSPASSSPGPQRRAESPRTEPQGPSVSATCLTGTGSAASKVLGAWRPWADRSPPRAAAPQGEARGEGLPGDACLRGVSQGSAAAPLSHTSHLSHLASFPRYARGSRLGSERTWSAGTPPTLQALPCWGLSS